jgi:hypothetical protein
MASMTRMSRPTTGFDTFCIGALLEPAAQHSRGADVPNIIPGR